MEHFVSSWGYLAIFVLTVAESACIPIPSELTLGLAGALASGVTLSGAVEHHPLNLGLVILVGIAGSVVGSFIAYGVGLFGGRAFVDRFGKYVLLTHKDLDRAESWFARHGDSTVLVGRVVPVVRTFVSFPAGVAEMPLVRFGIFTTIGVAVWVGVLSGIGYSLGSSYHSMVKAFGAATYVVAALVVVVLAVALVHRVRVVRAESASSSGREVGVRRGAAASGTAPGGAAEPTQGANEGWDEGPDREAPEVAATAHRDAPDRGDPGSSAGRTS